VPHRPFPPRSRIQRCNHQRAKNSHTQNQRTLNPALHRKPPWQPQKSRQKITTKRHLSRRPSCRQQKIVCNYLFGIFDKLGVSTRVELVLYSLQDRSAAQVELAS